MYDFLAHLANPYTFTFLVVAGVIVYLWRRSSLTRKQLLALTIPFALLTVMCLNPVAYLAVGSLEW